MSQTLQTSQREAKKQVKKKIDSIDSYFLSLEGFYCFKLKAYFSVNLLTICWKRSIYVDKSTLNVFLSQLFGQIKGSPKCMYLTYNTSK